MRSEGRISDEEYEALTRGYLAAAQAAAENPTDAAESGDEDATAPDEVGDPGGKSLKVSIRKDLTAGAITTLVLGAMVLLLASALGMLSWLVTIPTVLVLFTTTFQGWRVVTIIGALAVAAILIVSLTGAIGDDPVPQQTVTVTLPPQDPHPPIPGSLGIYMDQLTDLWNTVDGGPQIVKGLTRHNETGEYDTFIYRFGEWGRVAGAYDPENDAIYALLVTGQFSADATDQLYLNLCFVVASYSPECIASYHEEGLAGGTLEDFTDLTHEAEWTLGEDTWRLVTEGNVMTIRVFGPDAA